MYAVGCQVLPAVTFAFLGNPRKARTGWWRWRNGRLVQRWACFWNQMRHVTHEEAKKRLVTSRPLSPGKSGLLNSLAWKQQKHVACVLLKTNKNQSWEFGFISPTLHPLQIVFYRLINRPRLCCIGNNRGASSFRPTPPRKPKTITYLQFSNQSRPWRTFHSIYVTTQK